MDSMVVRLKPEPVRPADGENLKLNAEVKVGENMTVMSLVLMQRDFMPSPIGSGDEVHLAEPNAMRGRRKAAQRFLFLFLLRIMENVFKHRNHSFVQCLGIQTLLDKLCYILPGRN